MSIRLCLSIKQSVVYTKDHDLFFLTYTTGEEYAEREFWTQSRLSKSCMCVFSSANRCLGIALYASCTGTLSLLSLSCISISRSLMHPVSQSSFVKTSHSSLSICFTCSCWSFVRWLRSTLDPRAHLRDRLLRRW